MRRCSYLLLAALLASVALSLPSRADDCSGASSRVLKASTATVGATLTHDRTAGWSMAIAKGTNTKTWKVPALDPHAHVDVIIPAANDRVALLDANAGGLNRKYRLSLYDLSGKVLKVWTLEQLIGKEGLGRVSRSTSHIQWLVGPPKLDASGNTLLLTTAWNATIQVPLTK